MFSFFLQLWICSAVVLISAHLALALAIDGHLDLGVWATGALILFALLGPIGLICETILLLGVLADLRKDRDAKNRQLKARGLRKPKTPTVPHTCAGFGE